LQTNLLENKSNRVILVTFERSLPPSQQIFTFGILGPFRGSNDRVVCVQYVWDLALNL